VSAVFHNNKLMDMFS